ncbi:MAG: DUF2062 domain-containing protein [Moraxella sp.]|nr:DUF2062 domain-containing protein [Moraxella sp.]
MPKKHLKVWLPTPEKLQESRIIRWFAPFLSDPRLWHMNRNALNRAVYIGVFCAFLPLPGQMPLAVIGALVFRANVPMAIALTWLTNPITAIPISWFAYYVGAILLGQPPLNIHAIATILSQISAWLMKNGDSPFYNSPFSLTAFGLGLLICAIITSIIAGVIFRFIWQYHTMVSWRKRHGYNENAPKFTNQKGRKPPPDDFSI